jgi:hypothetical protein
MSVLHVISKNAIDPLENIVAPQEESDLLNDILNTIVDESDRLDETDRLFKALSRDLSTGSKNVTLLDYEHAKEEASYDPHSESFVPLITEANFSLGLELHYAQIGIGVTMTSIPKRAFLTNKAKECQGWNKRRTVTVDTALQLVNEVRCDSLGIEANSTGTTTLTIVKTRNFKTGMYTVICVSNLLYASLLLSSIRSAYTEKEFELGPESDILARNLIALEKIKQAQYFPTDPVIAEADPNEGLTTTTAQSVCRSFLVIPLSEINEQTKHYGKLKDESNVALVFSRHLEYLLLNCFSESFSIGIHNVLNPYPGYHQIPSWRLVGTEGPLFNAADDTGKLLYLFHAYSKTVSSLEEKLSVAVKIIRNHRAMQLCTNVLTTSSLMEPLPLPINRHHYASMSLGEQDFVRSSNLRFKLPRWIVLLLATVCSHKGEINPGFLSKHTDIHGCLFMMPCTIPLLVMKNCHLRWYFGGLMWQDLIGARYTEIDRHSNEFLALEGDFIKEEILISLNEYLAWMNRFRNCRATELVRTNMNACANDFIESVEVQSLYKEDFKPANNLFWNKCSFSCILAKKTMLHSFLNLRMVREYVDFTKYRVAAANAIRDLYLAKQMFTQRGTQVISTDGDDAPYDADEIELCVSFFFLGIILKEKSRMISETELRFLL